MKNKITPNQNENKQEELSEDDFIHQMAQRWHARIDENRAKILDL